jgi:hypothetical protein
MNFLPYEKLSYKSPLEKKEAIEKLADKIDPAPPVLNWKSAPTEQPFKGYIEENKFTITKIRSGRDKSTPYFFGEIHENKDGITVDITIKPKQSLIVFTLIAYAIIILVGLTILIGQDRPLWPVGLFPFGMVLFSYATSVFSFKFQASFIKDDLMKIFSVPRDSQ